MKSWIYDLIKKMNKIELKYFSKNSFTFYDTNYWSKSDFSVLYK